MKTLLLTFAGFTAVLICLNAFLLFLPFSRAELSVWRKLRVQRLRHYVTKRKNVIQPLSNKTPSIAKRHILWHIIMTVVMFAVVANAYGTSDVIMSLLAVFSVIASIAWLVGSVIQRQKLAVLHFSRHIA